MNDLTLLLSGLSFVGGKSVVARFDGGMLSSNSGGSGRDGNAAAGWRLARCIDDPRCPTRPPTAWPT
ncbi:hypothetical protein AJ88_22200 [Mesorhizobium amorphae CCBAU 01583]|nr:hypothetical protein AJ88_22200 [Mesorhizobium amorphae CCBAU 01583]